MPAEGAGVRLQVTGVDALQRFPDPTVDQPAAGRQEWTKRRLPDSIMGKVESLPLSHEHLTPDQFFHGPSGLSSSRPDAS
jgi:hypothetical protein